MVDIEEDLVRVPTLDYLTFLKLSFRSSVKYWSRFQSNYSHNYSFPQGFFDDVRSHCSVDIVDLLTVIFLAILWTDLRIRATRRVFLPLSGYFAVSRENSAKVPESCWKLIFYSFMWCMSVYIMLYSERSKYFYDPLSIWDDWHSGMALPGEIRFVYIIQCSFYLHSVYGTLYLDIWKKDSIPMLIHHILSIVLIGFSYAAKHHGVGALVLLLHDIADVILEFTKLNVYMKDRAGQNYWINDLMANVGFALFAFSWYWCRLYLYPLKVLYVGLYGSVEMAPATIPFIPVFNAMLWLLLLMHTYWFHFIVIFAYKLATGQNKDLRDTREYESRKKDSDSEDGTACTAIENGIVGKNQQLRNRNRPQK